MPLTDIGSYVPVMDEFAAHWAEVNMDLGGGPATDLKLQGGYTRANFVAERGALSAAITELEDLENGRQIAAANRDTQKAALRQKLGQFRAMLRAVIPNSKYAAAAQVMPDYGTSESKFLAPFDDMHSLWTRINADATLPGFTPPMLIGTYALATFAMELAALRIAYGEVTIAESDLTVGREGRNALLPPARERMLQYRSAVEATFGVDHPLTLSLPDLSPAPGSTSDPVTLSGAWNAGLGEAVFNWTPSTAATLEEYILRWSPGSTYDSATSSLVGVTFPGTTTLSTALGLPAPGAVASFKVFVKLSTGNEAGSNTVTIARP